jgi:hypothetical protein
VTWGLSYAPILRKNWDPAMIQTRVEFLSSGVPVTEKSKQHLIGCTGKLGVGLETSALEVLDRVSLTVGCAYFLEFLG